MLMFLLAHAALVAPKDWKKTNEEYSSVDPLHKETEVRRCFNSTCFNTFFMFKSSLTLLLQIPLLTSGES